MLYRLVFIVLDVDSHSLILGGFTAVQTSELFKNQQNQICPYNYINITED